MTCVATKWYGVATLGGLPKVWQRGQQNDIFKDNFIIGNQNLTVVFKDLIAYVPKIRSFVSVKGFTIDRPTVHIVYSRPVMFQPCS